MYANILKQFVGWVEQPHRKTQHDHVPQYRNSADLPGFENLAGLSPWKTSGVTHL